MRPQVDTTEGVTQLSTASGGCKKRKFDSQIRHCCTAVLLQGDRVAQRASNDEEHAGSAARMMLCVQVFQALPSDAGVDLSGRQAAVPKQHLHHPQVGAMIEQMGGKACRIV